MRRQPVQLAQALQAEPVGAVHERVARIGQRDTRSTINGYVKFNGLKIGAGWLHRKNDGSATTPKSDLWYLGAAYPLTPSFVVDAELFRLKFKDSSNKATLGAVRGTYSLSSSTCQSARRASCCRHWCRHSSPPIPRFA